MYKFIIRPFLFLIDAESAHHIVFSCMKASAKLPGIKSLLSSVFCYKHTKLERNILGLRFENPVGLAAGLDKDAKLIDELSCFGFGFIEIGTLTPRPQPGNDKPRLFRLRADKALVNRMGFNNGGAEEAAKRLKKRNAKVIVGGNIGKNKHTPNEQAFDDYAACVEALHQQVDYFVVNVSSPNTPGLRELQEKEPLRKLLTDIKLLTRSKPKPKPVLLKISPDVSNPQLDDIIEILKETGTDGIIATNTTISRSNLVTSKDQLDKIGNGGLSGKPLNDRSTEVIRYLRNKLGPQYPIIGVGGIMTPHDAVEKIKAGADLIQIYTGFIYEGPGFVKQLNRELARI